MEDKRAGEPDRSPALPPPGRIPSLEGMVEERTHKSLWTVTAPARRYPALTGELEVDVVVIGGGIAGLTTAWLLKQEGKRVAVVEMHRLLTGQTGQTTAHLTELLDTPYATLMTDFGEKGARMAAESSRAAIEKIAGLVERLRISCGFQRLPGFRYAETEQEARELEREATAARQAGLMCSLTEEVPLPYRVRLALRVEDQAQFHPREYLLALAEGVQGDGSYIFEETQVVELNEGVPCRVHTSKGVITCRDVVEATTTPLNRVFLHTKLYPYRTYAVAARLAAPLEAGLYYDSQDPYHYIRTQRVEGVDYLIVGGEDHKVGTEEDTERCFKALEEYTRRRFPVTELTHRWSGQVIEPADGLAYIGRNSGSRHVWVATGFSGTGMTFGTLSGMILTDLILGRQNPYAALYDATRVKPKAGAKDFIQENAEVAFRFVADRLAKPQGHDLSEVPPGEGRILEVDGKKVAVFREEQGGAVHAVSPVCTHLGCHVHWNKAERSWDCPCHGSRFSPTGEVLNGPAVKGLPSKKVR
jgi:glycine/D-amino acid oxidase-like deaminating enzyme/nitrite reductase/ring-hydroxylating ferredoxin subunit